MARVTNLDITCSGGTGWQQRWSTTVNTCSRIDLATSRASIRLQESNINKSLHTRNWWFGLCKHLHHSVAIGLLYNVLTRQRRVKLWISHISAVCTVLCFKTSTRFLACALCPKHHFIFLNYHAYNFDVS